MWAKLGKVRRISVWLFGITVTVLYFLYVNSNFSGYIKKKFVTNLSHKLSKKIEMDWNKTFAKVDSEPTHQTWLPVDSDTMAAVYSAYYDVDVDNSRSVRVIAIGLTKADHVVACVFQLCPKCKYTKPRPAFVEVMPETNNARYAPFFINCSLPDNIKPYAVSVIGHDQTELTHLLLVKYPEPFRFNITFCLPPIHSNYDNENEAINTIEMDKILGVEHFVVYSYDVGPRVRNVLHYYKSSGILDIKTWNLPKVEIHYYGQVAAINDCVCANRGKSKYVIVKDFDEIIVPYKHKTLTSLTAAMMNEYPNAGCFMFRHSFFQLSWPDDVIGFKYAAQAKRLKINPLLKVWRESFIYQPNVRSKTIYRPERVAVSGIHCVLKMRSGFFDLEISITDGLVHHYRNYRDKKTTTPHKEIIVRTYSEQLIQNCEKTLKSVQFIDNVTKVI